MPPLGLAAFRDRRLVSVAFLAFVFVAALVLTAAGQVRRSEARGPRPPERPAVVRSFAWDGRQDLSYAYLGRGSTVQMGSGGAWEDFTALRDRFETDVLWFSLRGRRFIVSDRGVLAEARSILAPMNEVGAKQGRLGELQARLGERQAALGEKQAWIGLRQAALSGRLAALALEGADTPEQDAIDEALHDLGDRMDDLARLQEPLAREQEELGRRQAELGRWMQRVQSCANQSMRGLAERAIRDGHAVPFRD